MNLRLKAQSSIFLAVTLAAIFFLSPSIAQATGALLNRPNQVVVQGNYAYVVSDASNSLEVIDISDPAYPRHAGSVDRSTSGVELFAPKSLDVAGDYAYIVSYNNDLEIFSISDPYAPSLVGKLKNGDGGTPLSRPHFIKVVDSYAYIAVFGSRVVTIVNVGDVNQPTKAAVISMGSGMTPLSLFVSGNYLYVVNQVVGGTGGDMRIYDISDPTTPILKSQISHGTDGAIIDDPGSIFVASNFAYVTSIQGHSLEVIDVSDPTSPTHAGKIVNGEDGADLLSPRMVFVEGNYAYVNAFVGNSLEIVDVSDPSAPRHKGKFHYEGEASSPISAVVEGNTAYVALNLENGLDVIDVSNAANPVRKAKILNGEIGSLPPLGCTTDCFSNVLFLPGLKASILKTGADTLWPPTVFDLSNDVLQLALTEDGESVNNVYVDGILKTVLSKNIYGGFSDFIDSISGEGEMINEWLPLAYDWRFSPEKIVEEGIKTKDGVMDVITQVEELAARSKSGKVAIVAHSYGGLLGKTIIKKLEEEGKGGLIESFVMVGSPQLGTPQAAASLLHGAGEDILGGFLVDARDIRAIGQNMPGAYSLLPTPEYFNAVTDPVIKFDPTASFTQLWRNIFGGSINTYDKYASFLLGGEGRDKPAENDLETPEVLRGDLLSNAKAFHEEYDNYQFPEDMRVVQVAGWGMPTTKGIEYKMGHGAPGYEVLFTREGDRTVVYPSAISSDADETYYFDIFANNKSLGSSFQHRDLLNIDSIKSLVSLIIKKEAINNIDYVSFSKPIPKDSEDLLRVSTHSPVILGAYDEHGNFTGIDPEQDLSAQILEITEDIPGSSFSYTGESQYIFLPKEGTYNFIYKGTGEGPTTLKIDNFIEDEIIPILAYEDIPTTSTTTATFVLESEEPKNTVVELDTNSDGDVDKIISNLSSLEVTAENKIITLGSSMPSFTSTLSGFKEGDTKENSVTGTPDCTTTATSSSPVSSYPITCTKGTLASSKYVFETFIPGTLKIIYPYGGFTQPINDIAYQSGQGLSVFKAGSTVPVKFQLKKADGTIMQANSLPVWLTPQRGAAMSAAIDETVYSASGTTGNTYRWDPEAKQYIYNWSTKGLAAGYWYKIYTKLDDGNIYSVTIGLK